MKIGKFFGKGKILKNFHRVGHFLENRGKSETWGMHHGLRGDGRPCQQLRSRSASIPTDCSGFQATRMLCISILVMLNHDCAT